MGPRTAPEPRPLLHAASTAAAGVEGDAGALLCASLPDLAHDVYFDKVP